MLRNVWCPHCKQLREVEVSTDGIQVCSVCHNRVSRDNGARIGEPDSYN